MMLGSFDSVQQAASLARIVGVTLGGPAPAERSQGPIGRPGTALVVHDVHHRYGTGHDVLHGVQLELPAGKRLGGRRRHGVGQVHVGEPRRGPAPPVLGTGHPRRSRIMLVTQEHHRCPGTIADNLRLARRDASVSDLAAALAAVGASGWTPWSAPEASISLRAKYSNSPRPSTGRPSPRPRAVPRSSSPTVCPRRPPPTSWW